MKNIKFSCQGSGNCCVSRGSYGYVYLSSKDLKILSKCFNQTISEFKKKYCSKTDGFLHLDKNTSSNQNCLILRHFC